MNKDKDRSALQSLNSTTKLSKILNKSLNKIRVSSVSAFDDNYIWFIHGLPELQAKNKIIIVDPGDAEPVIQAIESNHYTPIAIFITHHHADHTGGIDSLVEQYQLPVYGPANEKIAHISHPLSKQDTLSFDSMGLSFKILDVPGHTIGHIAYLGHQCLFIGDTLFAGGCGRIFEGTTQQMHHSLNQLLSLDDATMVYCAHEYTQDNLRFAIRVEPDNSLLQQRIIETDIKRQKNLPSVPSSLILEKETNPFLRFDNSIVKQAAEDFAQKHLNSAADVFAMVRYWKDTLD